MIRCTIVETNAQSDDPASRIARATVSETLSLGRGAACKIYLPDPRVRLEHAKMERAEDGYLYLEGIGGSVQVDGEPQERIRVSSGQHIVVGPFEFVVGSLAHGPNTPQILLTLNFTHKPAEAVASNATQGPVGIRQSLLSVRNLSWGAALLAMVFLLLLPLWQAYQPKPVNSGTHNGRLDLAWNPGPLSSAHQTIGNQCRNCHTKPFQRVTDAACSACHKDAGPHTRDTALESQAFSGQRCAACHREHQGENGMKMADATDCETCHRNVSAFARAAPLPNVGNFALDHPDFRLTMKVATPALTTERRTRTPSLKEANGLSFPHEVHLAAKGVKSPTGPVASAGRVVLECSNCHRLDSAKVRFEPIRMERDCAGCHRLSVDAQNPTRQVPHGQPQVVVHALNDLFSALALERNPSQVVTVNTLLQSPQIQPGTAATTSAARWVVEKTKAAATDMFDNPKGTCRTCHTITRAGNTSTPGPADWTVQPVLTTDHWLPKARFSHAQHTNATCESCHQARGSRSSADILIPTITTCRNCHTGTGSKNANVIWPDKVASQCDSCHGFHAPVVHASFATDKARGQTVIQTSTSP